MTHCKLNLLLIKELFLVNHLFYLPVIKKLHFNKNQSEYINCNLKICGNPFFE